ncbi:MAG: hypothetical protein ACTSR7_15440 [Promethearchaeota archaeon]
MGYYCNICKKDITKAEFFYSIDKFGRALCREHQELERRAQKRSFQSERQEGPAKFNAASTLSNEFNLIAYYF